MRYVCAMLLGLSLAGCAGGPPPSQDADRLSPAQITAAQRVKIEGAVRGELKDPDSARFGVLVGGVDPTGKMSVCGLVNAKNSFGGYTGNQAFIGSFMMDGSFFVSAIERPTGYDAVREVCNRRGLFI